MWHGPGVETPVADTWRRPRPTREQIRVDAIAGAVVTAVVLLNLTFTNSAGMFMLGRPPAVWEQVLWTLAQSLPVTVRRLWPDTAALVTAVAFIAAQVRAVPEQQLTSAVLFAVIYTLGAWGRDHRRAHRLRIAIIVAMFGWLCVSILLSLPELSAADFEDAAGPISPIIAALANNTLVNLLFFGFAYYCGEVGWLAARREHLLSVQAAELRTSQAAARERAVGDERVRIARELHDVVAHHVSVMGVQAAAARRVLERDAGKARTALAAVEQSARTAVDELRRMLGLLRQPGPTAGPEHEAAGIDRVAELVAGVREAGLVAEVGVYGDPAALPDSLSRAVYRIVQEAATNTLKHAGAGHLDVRIRYLDSELEIDVADDGRGPGGPAEGGMGLIGMRERVAAHDGVLETGPATGGRGFRVRARFPLSRAAVAS